MNISTTDARGVFTQMLIEKYQERPKVYSFLRSFFPTKEESTLELSIEVRRGTEYVASDVVRGTLGNRNDVTRSTQKIIIPPYFREWFDATQLQLYDRLFGSTSIDSGVFAAFLEAVNDKLGMMQDKIERAYELQCAQALLTGIVTLKSGDNIDYKRKAASLVDKSASTWATGTNKPLEHLEEGGDFLRNVGKVQGGVLNAIMGTSAFNALINNASVKDVADIRNFSLVSVRENQRNSVGGILKGAVTAGSYDVLLWTYPESYQDSSNNMIPYVDPKKVVLLPETTNFKLGFGAVPQLIDEENPTPVKGAYVFEDYKDKKHATHEYHIKSAGIAIPVAVDQIYTMQVLA